jgi:hypothetical protein
MRKTLRDLIFILLIPVLCLGIFSQIFIFHSPSAHAQSATFSISPPGGSFSVGEEFSVAISVHSDGSPINAAEATLNFSNDLLTITSLSESGSIFEFWTPGQPAFLDGSITFGGGAPSSFSGSSGKLLTVNFKAKKQGEARVIFSGGRILAADGKGTDIFSGSSGASYKITAAAPPVIPKPKPKVPVIPAPEVPEVPIIELPVKPEITPTEEVQPPVEIGPWKISRFYMPLIFVTLLILGVMGLTLLLRNVRK